MDLRANAIIQGVDRFSPMLRRIGAMGGAFASRAGAIASASRRVGSALTGTGGLGAAMGSAAFIGAQLTFEESLNRTQAILDIASKEGFKPLRDDIIEVSKRYPALRTEIAKGTSELAMSGMALDTIRAVLEGVVQGSMASGESIRTVGEGVTDVVMGMGMPFKTAREQAAAFATVNDVLAASSTSANDTYTGFLESMRRAGPVARIAGVNLMQLAAAHGVLANAGIKGERAGIALRSMMVRALAPTKKARELMRAAGVDWTKWTKASDKPLTSGGLFDMLSQGNVDTSGLQRVRGRVEQLLNDPIISKNVGVLGDKVTEAVVNGLGIDASQQEDRAQIGDLVREYLATNAAALDFKALFSELADKDASLPLLKELLSLHHVEKAGALTDAFARGLFDEMEEKIKKKAPGATERFAGIMTQGFVGAFRRMQSAFDAFLDTLANTGVMDTLTGVFQGLADTINRIGKTNPALLENLTYAMLAFGALAPVGLTISAVASAIGALFFALAVWPAGTIIGMTTGLYLLYEAFQAGPGVIDRVTNYFTEVWGRWAKFTESMNNLELGRAFEYLTGQRTASGLYESDAAELSGMLPAHADVRRSTIKASEDAARAKQQAAIDAANAQMDRFTQAMEVFRNAPVVNNDAGVPLPGSARAASASGGLVRDINPVVVDSKVSGTMTGEFGLDVRVQVDGPGRVTDTRTSGGRGKGELNTGRSDIDIIAP